MILAWGIIVPILALIFILFFQVLNKIYRDNMVIYKINELVDSSPLRAEVRNTCYSLITFCIIGLITGYLIEQGWTKVYTDVKWGIFQILYLPSSFFIGLFLHDIYFYFSHRILHTKLVFKYIHSVHHETYMTNVWAAFSFHPVEGIIQIGIIPLVAFIFPIHVIILVIYTAFILFMTVYGHSGYELRHNKPGTLHFFNTSLHHSQHHEFVHFNYGIYLNVWDRIFRTNHPSYVSDFKKLKNRINKSSR